MQTEYLSTKNVETITESELSNKLNYLDKWEFSYKVSHLRYNSKDKVTYGMVICRYEYEDILIYRYDKFTYTHNAHKKFNLISTIVLAGIYWV